MEAVIVCVELTKEPKLIRLFKYFPKFTMGKGALICFRGCCLYVYYTIRTREVWGLSFALISHQMFHLKKTGHVSRLVLHKKRDTELSAPFQLLPQSLWDVLLAGTVSCTALRPSNRSVCIYYQTNFQPTLGRVSFYLTQGHKFYWCSNLY